MERRTLDGKIKKGRINKMRLNRNSRRKSRWSIR
jgi:hypothetical protein